MQPKAVHQYPQSDRLLFIDRLQEEDFNLSGDGYPQPDKKYRLDKSKSCNV